jgi:hypothetical protein
MPRDGRVPALVLILAARLSDVPSNGRGRQVSFTVALFVLPLLYAVPYTRPVLDRAAASPRAAVSRLRSRRQLRHRAL